MARIALWKKALIGVVIAATTLSYLIYTLMSAQAWRCEVCITYKGHSACRAAQGESKREAYSTAAHLACSELANGVTERLACPNTPPTSTKCAKH